MIFFVTIVLALVCSLTIFCWVYFALALRLTWQYGAGNYRTVVMLVWSIFSFFATFGSVFGIYRYWDFIIMTTMGP